MVLATSCPPDSKLGSETPPTVVLGLSPESCEAYPAAHTGPSWPDCFATIRGAANFGQPDECDVYHHLDNRLASTEDT
jgi:hypothetical protein